MKPRIGNSAREQRHRLSTQIPPQRFSSVVLRRRGHTTHARVHSTSNTHEQTAPSSLSHLTRCSIAPGTRHEPSNASWCSPARTRMEDPPSPSRSPPACGGRCPREWPHHPVISYRGEQPVGTTAPTATNNERSKSSRFGTPRPRATRGAKVSHKQWRLRRPAFHNPRDPTKPSKSLISSCNPVSRASGVRSRSASGGISIEYSPA